MAPANRRLQTDNSEPFATLAFCIIGLLLTLNFILYFPDLGAVIAQYNQF
jgi:hypothetical protein